MSASISFLGECERANEPPILFSVWDGGGPHQLGLLRARRGGLPPSRSSWAAPDRARRVSAAKPAEGRRGVHIRSVLRGHAAMCRQRAPRRDRQHSPRPAGGATHAGRAARPRPARQRRPAQTPGRVQHDPPRPGHSTPPCRRLEKPARVSQRRGQGSDVPGATSGRGWRPSSGGGTGKALGWGLK
jgi:hypothetical protein